MLELDLHAHTHLDTLYDAVRVVPSHGFAFCDESTPHQLDLHAHTHLNTLYDAVRGAPNRGSALCDEFTP